MSTRKGIRMSNSRGYKTAFIIELVALFMAIVLVTLVFTGVFVMCRNRSDKAAILNESVLLAVSAAELSSASPDIDALQDAMASADNAVGHTSRYSRGSDDSSGSVWILASAGENSGHRYIVRVKRMAEKDSSYVSDIIDVFDAGKADDIDEIDDSSLTDPVYTLETGSRQGKEAGA